MFKKLCFLIILFSISSVAPSLFAQTISDQVDSYILKAMAERHIPGLSLAVIRDGIPVKIKGYGFADIENKTTVNPETIFLSGSLGKMFTATAIMKLKEDGKLKLDDKIAAYFKNSPATWQNITIRNLLNHTSGIPDYENENLIDLQKNYTEAELLQLAMKMPLDFQPGEKWAYSSTAYVVLGILIRQITGKFYGDILQEKIFLPLSMETTRIINESDILLNRSSGYELNNGEWKNQSWVSPTLNTTADGSLYFSTLDLIKWDAAITNEKILNHDDLQTMFTPAKLNNGSFYPYGFGWFLHPVNGYKSIQQGGSWQGFNNFIAKFTDDKLTVVVLTNLNPSNPGLIGRDVAAFYISELSRPAVTVIKDSNAALTILITELYKTPLKADLNNSLFAKEATPAIKLLTTSNDYLLKTFGQVQSVLPVENIGNANQTKYLIKYKVGARLATVTMNSLGKIINIITEAA